MWEAAAGWIRQLIALAVLVGLLDLLTPDSALRGMVRLVMGVAVMAAVLSPLVGQLPAVGAPAWEIAPGLFRAGPGPAPSPRDPGGGAAAANGAAREQWLAAGERLRQRAQQAALESLEGRIEQHLQAVLRLLGSEDPGQLEVLLAPDGRVIQIGVGFSPAAVPPPERQERIRQGLAQLYGLPPERVRVGAPAGEATP